MSRLAHNTTSLGLAVLYALMAVLGHALHDHGGCDHIDSNCGNVACCDVGYCNHHSIATADQAPAATANSCSCQHHQTEVACCPSATTSQSVASHSTGKPTERGSNPATETTTQQAVFAASPHSCLGCQLISQLSVGYYCPGIYQAEQTLSCRIACDYQQPQLQGIRQAAFARGPPAIS